MACGRSRGTTARRRDVLGLKVLRDENNVRDRDVLCHEAAGPRYAGDLTVRDNFLEEICLPPVQIEADPPFAATLRRAAPPLRIVARRTDIADPVVAEQPGVRLEFSATGGTVGAATGVTGADGSFSTTATSSPRVADRHRDRRPRRRRRPRARPAER